MTVAVIAEEILAISASGSKVARNETNLDCFVEIDLIIIGRVVSACTTGISLLPDRHNGSITYNLKIMALK